MIPRKFYEAEEGGGGISKPDIPKEIKKQIKDDARQYANDVSFGTYSGGFLQMGYEVGARVYYSLSQQQITSLQDKLDAAKLALKEIYTGTDFPLSVAQNALRIIDKK